MERRCFDREGRDSRPSKFEGSIAGTDIVFHLAAASRQSGSIESPELYFLPNELGTYNVAEACRSTPTRIIYTSTWVVYEKSKQADKRYSETTRLAP